MHDPAQAAFLSAACPPEEQDRAAPEGITIVEAKNVTNLESHAEGLAQRPADLTFIQDHCASLATLSRLR